MLQNDFFPRKFRNKSRNVYRKCETDSDNCKRLPTTGSKCFESKNVSKIIGPIQTRQRIKPMQIKRKRQNLVTSMNDYIYSSLSHVRVGVPTIYPNIKHLYFSQSLVHGLQEVDKLKSQVADVHVPLEVFE